MTSEASEQKNQPNPENQNLATTLANSIKDNNLAGDIRQRRGGRGIPLPVGSKISLVHSEPNTSRNNLRFYISENKSTIAYNIKPEDYGMGMDTMWFAYEVLNVSAEGIVSKEVEGWPNKDDGYSYGFFDRATTLPKEVFDEEKSREIIRELQLVVDAGVDLVDRGELVTVKQQDEIRKREMEERERRRNQK